MRLRFLTKATDRPRISYQIIRQIFQDFQRSARVDFAIPYIYSFRKGVQASARFDEAQQPSETTNVLLSEIEIDEDKWQRFLGSEEDISQLADRIKAEGLLQPVVLSPAEGGKYQVVTGHMRIEACKRLGWRSVPAVVRD